MLVMSDFEQLHKSMQDFTNKLQAQGYDKAIKAIEESVDYHHKPTDLKARIVALRRDDMQCYTLYLYSNVEGNQNEKLFSKDIDFSDIEQYSVQKHMEEYFANHVINHILDNTDSKNSIEKLMEKLDGHKHFS